MEMNFGMSLFDPADWTCTTYLGTILDSRLTSQSTLDGRTRYSVELTPVASLGFIPTSRWPDTSGKSVHWQGIIWL